MSERKKIREELHAQQAERLLSKQGKVPHWGLPDGYLQRMADDVIVKSGALKEMKVKRRRLSFRYVAAAAVVLLALGIWYAAPIDHDALPPVTASGWDDISTEDLQAYITDHLDEFDVDLLASYSLTTTEGQPPLPGNDISTEALENYLETEDWLLETELSDTFEEEL